VSAREFQDLKRTQQLFWALITAPEGVGPALHALEQRGASEERGFHDLFAGDERLPAVERLDIYANMYFFRLHDCLAEDFPKLKSAIGDAHFHTLIADYLLRHPSEQPSLRHLGLRLPEFIGAHPLSEEFPWLSDLARLEWARADVFDAADAQPLTREALARLPPETAGEATFTLIPALAIARFDHDVVRLWRLLEDSQADGEALHAHATGNAAREGADKSCAHGHDAGERLDPPARRTTRARVWRKDFVIHHCSLDEEEAQSLELVRSGGSIARLCQRLAAGRGLAKATERAGRMIQEWLDDGVLAGVTFP